MTRPQIPLIDGRLPDQRRYVLGDGHEPLLWIKAGTEVCFHTLDASGNQMTSATRAAEEIDPSSIFPVTGPVGVQGVAPGDAVGIEIVSIKPADTGHMWTRPGLGFGPSPGFMVREVDTNDLELQVGERTIRMPTRFMIGAVALEPLTSFQARDLGAHGGNLDSPEITEGATLWLRAQRTGGRLYVGDVHAAMGEAEVCGTGVEVPAELRLRLHSAEDWKPPCPLVVNGGRVWLIGIGTSLEEALEDGLTHLTVLLSERLGITAADAYIMAAALLEVRVCQVVNPHVSVAVSLSSGEDRLLVPEQIFESGHSHGGGEEGGRNG